MNNSDIIVHTLQEAGVRWVFGVPSGPVLPLIEALRQSPIQFVLTASETSAGFMNIHVGARAVVSTHQTFDDYRMLKN